jgi:hypothetical protein
MSKPSFQPSPLFVRAVHAFSVVALVALPALGCAKAKPAPTGDGSADVSGDGSSQSGAATGAASNGAAASASPATATATAPPAAGDPNVKPAATATDDVGAKLTQALQGVVFVSEAEFPWSVVEADATGATDVTAKLVADKLGPQIAKLQGGGGRDLGKLPVVTGQDGVAAFLASMASDPDDPSAAKYAEVAKLVAASLQGTQVFFFDMDDSGAQVSGPIITVVVGKTAASKLVAMVSFQVAS